MALNAEGHKRKSARAERSNFRYPLRGSALGKGKSGYMVHIVFLARDVPQEVLMSRRPPSRTRSWIARERRLRNL